MNDKTNLIDDDIPAHKKKSKNKGLPRSKHKHIYETVLLENNWHTTDFKTGKPKVVTYLTPTKVCTICGRVDYCDKDPSYYNEKCSLLFGCCFEKELSEKALALPKWKKDFFDKFAVKMEEEDVKL
jgi:hypothetical protein